MRYYNKNMSIFDWLVHVEVFSNSLSQEKVVM
jgi:hypothetical protein